MMENKETNGIQYGFSREADGFTIQGKFFTQSDPSCVIHVLYDFGHLAKFMTIANSVELLQQGDNWQEVSYLYEKLIFKTKINFRRTLKQEEQKILFEMTGQPTAFLPKISSYNGYYELMPEKDGYWIKYFQKVKIESKILNLISFYQAKKDVVKFFKNLKKYIENACKDNV